MRVSGMELVQHYTSLCPLIRLFEKGKKEMKTTETMLCVHCDQVIEIGTEAIECYECQGAMHPECGLKCSCCEEVYCENCFGTDVDKCEGCLDARF